MQLMTSMPEARRKASLREITLCVDIARCCAIDAHHCEAIAETLCSALCLVLRYILAPFGFSDAINCRTCIMNLPSGSWFATSSSWQYVHFRLLDK